MAELYIGLDFGQAHDYTAVAIVERVLFDSGKRKEYEWRFEPIMRSEYHVKHLQRFPLKTPYPKIVGEIKTMKQRPELKNSMIVADQTGVGRPVIDMLYAAGMEALGVTITGGHVVTMQPGAYMVPKKNLISTLQVLLQSQRLKFAAGLPDTKTLIDELKVYQVKVTGSANETFNAREGAHDDLVLAVALGVWLPYRQYGIDG